ncbi:hypothetical protein HDF24_11440 [Mucilaginibacter sp. X4EP1]|uniref:hypothetical protein n=1 Tax=Mucilaginibacter sp. X4EP1 TaxID=2723092 RepID=UPI0021694F74|nr:hypothetical protein [Mucilaginibacter sp. X4EP1]MCS3816621.1 hypothetical protein [Mucilaginibacter sp. X4EP1]
MDLKEIYTYIIEKGDLFGIVCVVVLIILQAAIRKIPATSETLSQILKFLQWFIVISLGFIILLKIFTSPRLAPDVSNSSNQNQSNVEKNGNVTKVKPKTFVLNTTTSLKFSSDSLFVLQKNVSPNGIITIDTPINDALTRISIIKVDDEDSKLSIYDKNNDGQLDDIDLSEHFDEKPLHSYIDRLQSAGYSVQYEYEKPGFFYYFKLILCIPLLIYAGYLLIMFIQLAFMGIRILWDDSRRYFRR